MPTEQQAETLTRRQVAEAFVEKWSIFASPVDAVELLLKCRDERAARIADEVAKRANAAWQAAYKRNDSSPMKVYNGRRLAAEDIAAAIRNKGHK